MGKSFLANIPPCTCEKSGLELGLAQDVGLLGNLGGQARSGKLTGKQAACLATGKALPQRGILERELRSCWGLGQRGITTTHPPILIEFYHFILT
jgi:hypothetical protein